MKKTIVLCKKLCFVLLALAFVHLTSCKNDDIPSESYYTFTGETLTSYLQSDPDFSMYYEFVKRSRQPGSTATLPALLSSYGYFTCFAPTNKAITTYLNGLGCNSIEDIYTNYPETQADSIINLVAQMHVISSGSNATVYESKNFDRKIPDQNLYGKILYIEPYGDSYIVNDMSHIVTRDVKLHNGVLHGVDAVIEPSDVRLQEFFAMNPRYTIFGRLMELTRLDRDGRILTIPEVYDYVVDQTDYEEYKLHDLHIEVPQKLEQYYTVFIEPDSVYTLRIPDLATVTTLEDTLDLVKAFAKDWFDTEYAGTPEHAEGDNENWSDPSNYLNRFVAYHVVNKHIARAEFTEYNIGLESSYGRIKEFYETIAPNQELYLSAGKNGHAWVDGVDPDPNRVVLNPSPEEAIFNLDKDWGRPLKDGPIISPRTVVTQNGFFHEIGDILVFPRNNFKKIRFRHDMSTLHPEIQSNFFRYKYRRQGRIVFPENFLSNIKYITPGTVYLMISPNLNTGWGYNGHQGDEMFAYNNYDFVLRLPPVPAGTYEVRMGFTSAEARGCAQFFLGTEDDCDWEAGSFDGLKPCGIPVDLTVTISKHGWKPDVPGDLEATLEIDKEMRATGWMKGPNSWRCQNGNSTRSLRETETVDGTGHSPSRYILGQVEVKRDGPIFVRARNVTGMSKVELMMDYFEICPDNIYNNPFSSEPRD